MPYDEKVMINCATSMIERCDNLRDHIAQHNLRGKANRSDVIRAALEAGLEVLELVVESESDPDVAKEIDKLAV